MAESDPPPRIIVTTPTMTKQWVQTDEAVVKARILREARDTLRRMQWGAQGKCPCCGRPQAYQHHVCSCPVQIALRDLDRVLEAHP